MKPCWVVVLLASFWVLGLPSAHARNPRHPLNPLGLTCLLRDGKFFTEITFSKNQDQVLTGEMGNYVSTPDHGRRFMSGVVFFDLEVEPRLIQGSTGDKRGSVSAFRLYPAYKSLNGEWVYEQFDGNTAPAQVRFHCKYRG